MSPIRPIQLKSYPPPKPQNRPRKRFRRPRGCVEVKACRWAGTAPCPSPGCNVVRGRQGNGPVANPLVDLARSVQSLADAVAVSAGGDPDLRSAALAVRNHLWDIEREQLGDSESRRAWGDHLQAIEAQKTKYLRRPA